CCPACWPEEMKRRASAPPPPPGARTAGVPPQAERPSRSAAAPPSPPSARTAAVPPQVVWPRRPAHKGYRLSSREYEPQPQVKERVRVIRQRIIWEIIKRRETKKYPEPKRRRGDTTSVH